jgi:hypothetical protein
VCSGTLSASDPWVVIGVNVAASGAAAAVVSSVRRMFLKR